MDLVEMAQALAERDAGMARAINHANEDHHNWSDEAYAFLCQFAKQHQSFISEDVSDRSKATGFPQPPTDRAWGSVYRRAARESVIIQVGTGRSRRRNASICPRWGSLVYRGQ